MKRLALALAAVVAVGCGPKDTPEPVVPTPPVDLVAICFRAETRMVESYWDIFATGSYRVHEYGVNRYSTPTAHGTGEMWKVVTPGGWLGIEWLHSSGDYWVQVPGGYHDSSPARFCG